jgi:LPXTG-site transpeptidase (sortase) family protein
MRSRLVVCLFMLTLPAGSGVPLSTWSAAPMPAASTASASAPGPVAALPAPRVDPAPNRLLIPRIAVDAAIESRGLDANRALSTPLDFNDVAWFNQSPAPGQPGNAVINGHVDWWTGDAVFTRLSELRQGDAVTVVHADGTRSSFKVTGYRTLGAPTRDAGLFAPGRLATLTLITCAGWWDPRLGSADKRLLVSAALD